jgi:glucose-1-phosphate thymidylyltransferase
MLTICACGGSGTRMAPATRFINKHLLPVGYGDLMIDMPLRFLAMHHVDELTIVTGSNHATQICEYVGDGEKYGFTRVDYHFQPKPLGIADVFNRVSHKDVSDGVTIILGDNYFSDPQGMGLTFLPGFAYVWEFDLGDIEKAKAFGQVIRDDHGLPTSIVEKPKIPTHGKILTGLYHFPSSVFDVVKCLEPSQRGELEITDLIKTYLERNRLHVLQVEGEWADLGEHDAWAGFVAGRFEDHG